MALPLKKREDTNTVVLSSDRKDHVHWKTVPKKKTRRKISVPKKSSALNKHIKESHLKNIVSRCQNQHTLIRTSKLNEGNQIGERRAARN